MKNLLLLLLPTILFISCENDLDIEDSNLEQTSNLSRTNLENIISSEFSLQKFGGSKVAYKLNNEIKLGVSHEELINSFNNYSIKSKLGHKAFSLQILKIEEESYIRFSNDDGSVSTVALLNTSNKNFTGLMILGETVCTSSKCSNCCGCLPDGDYCSICTLGTTDDCKRSTSS